MSIKAMFAGSSSGIPQSTMTTSTSEQVLSTPRYRDWWRCGGEMPADAWWMASRMLIERRGEARGEQSLACRRQAFYKRSAAARSCPTESTKPPPGIGHTTFAPLLTSHHPRLQKTGSLACSCISWPNTPGGQRITTCC